MSDQGEASHSGSGRVLVAEDEPTARAIMLAVVEASGLEAVEAHDGLDALEKASRGAVDLILLDMNLPGMSGLDVCRRLRGRGDNVPIIIVTAATEPVDAVVALEVGADDYVRKPFHARELAARVTTQMRSARLRVRNAPTVELNYPGLTIDLASRRVRRDGVDVHLTNTEFNLLRALAEAPNSVVTRRQLMEQVWHRKVEDSRTIDAHMYRLRQKIEPQDARQIFIRNIPGVGYRFSVP